MFTIAQYLTIMSFHRHPVLTSAVALVALSWVNPSLSSPLLPSQDQPNFFNVRICRDRQVLSALKTGAVHTLKVNNVTIANGSGPKWTGYRPDDIHLEAVSISPGERNAVFCSVTISAKGITERIVYVVGRTLDSWLAGFGGDTSLVRMNGRATQ
jgi:hypothetical protein